MKMDDFKGPKNAIPGHVANKLIEISHALFMFMLVFLSLSITKHIIHLLTSDCQKHSKGRIL